MLKRFFIPAFALLVILVASGFGIFYWWNLNSGPASAESTLTDFLILKGSPVSLIGDSLAKKGLIKSSLAFRVFVQVTGRVDKIQAGEYQLAPNFSLLKIVATLVHGPVEIWVTVPEGLRREEIAERFVSSFNRSPAQAATFRQEFLAQSTGEEGFLFPDTYLFPRTASTSAVVAKMLSTFDKRVDSQMREDIAKTKFSLNQVVTMASLIERETRSAEERPIVAGILYKRLSQGWPLEVDAALQYAVANSQLKSGLTKIDFWQTPTLEDKKINSAYNLYKFTGLPPTPIASPGLSSLTAAIYPQDSPYWFYLHDKDGKIHYAKTLEEHNRNIDKYIGG